MSLQLDEVDRGIMRALARNARDATTRKMADQTGVSASTVRNRLDRLERRGDVQEYVPEIDYEAVGLPLRVILVCTVSVGDRRPSPDALADLDGTTSVAETMAHRSAIYATTVAAGGEPRTRRHSLLGAIFAGVKPSACSRITTGIASRNRLPLRKRQPVILSTGNIYARDRGRPN